MSSKLTFTRLSVDDVIDPALRRVAELTRDLDNVEEDHRAARRHFDAHWAALIDPLRAELEEAVAALSEVYVRRKGGGAVEEPEEKRVPGRKPKRRWKQIAVAIKKDPTASYADIALAVYGDADDANIKTLRTTVHRMKNEGVLEGGPGEWKLVIPVSDIEWFETTEKVDEDVLRGRYRSLRSEIEAMKGDGGQAPDGRLQRAQMELDLFERDHPEIAREEARKMAK